MKFSPSRGAFFAPELELAYRTAGTWPDDLIEVTDDERSEFTAGAPSGKRLASVAGRPGWTDVTRFGSRDAAARMVSAHVDNAAARLTGPIPTAERASWPVKATAAASYLLDAADPDQAAMINLEAATRGETGTVTAERIVQRARTYSQAIARLSGIRATVQLALTADGADLDAIVADGIATIDTIIAEYIEGGTNA